MKRKVSGILGLVLLATALGSCDDDESGVLLRDLIALAVQPDSAQLAVGDTLRITVQVDGSANQSATFTSSDSAIASVTSSGLVTALAAGRAIIAVVADADPAVRDSVIINAFQPIVISLLPAAATLQVGEPLQLVAQVMGATNQDVLFRSSNENIVQVGTTGVVTPVALGEAFITAKAAADTTVLATSIITVIGPPVSGSRRR